MDRNQKREGEKSTRQGGKEAGEHEKEKTNSSQWNSQEEHFPHIKSTFVPILQEKND